MICTQARRKAREKETPNNTTINNNDLGTERKKYYEDYYRNYT